MGPAISAGDRLRAAFAHTSWGKSRRVLGIRLRRGRCLSALVTLAGQERIFIKQDPTPGVSLLKREALMLEELNASGALGRLTPRLIGFDEDTGILITAALDGSVPLDRVLKESLLADAIPAVAAASALAAVHGHPIAAGSFMENVPFPVAWMPPLTPAEAVRQPADFGRIAITLEQSRGTIDELAASWRHSYFIHGDFKSSNLLFRMARRADHPSLTIVDWEMAGTGDPLWDIGSYIGSILFAWVDVLAAKGARAANLNAAGANSLRRQVGYFLITYRRLSGRIADSTEHLVRAALAYAGIFLLHRVRVGLDITGLLDANGSLLLQLAASLLTHPERVVGALLPSLFP